MLKNILTLFYLFTGFSLSVIGQNCPDYSSTASGSGQACGNQNYEITVPNTGCNGEIYFDVVGNYGIDFANEITWEIESVQSGAIVSSGGPGTNGAAINLTVGPLDPAVHGNVFDLIVYDSWGDGFSPGGFIQTEQGGTVLANISGNFGAEAHSLFNANIIISAATITINTPSGNVVETVNNCNDFITQVPLSNANFCNSISVDLPWTITCDVSGAVIASGTHSVTVNPDVPSAASDLVEINWNTTTCSWDIVAQNDCDALDIGTVFNITPDPTGLPTDACSNANQNFTVEYLGLTGSPDCCSTAGPQVPITYNETQNSNDAVAQNSPFGGQNNSAFIDFPPNNSGGNASSLDLCFDMTNFCFDPPSTETDEDFYVFVYIDGNQVYQAGPLTGNSHSFCIDLTDVPGGYTQSSNIEIYTLPNLFSVGNPPTSFTTFNPNANCGSLADGEWTADFDVTLDVTFNQTIGSPVNCSFDITESQSCCDNTNLTASNPSSITVQCADDVPPADPSVVNDATSDCSAAPTVTFVDDVSDNNTCDGEEITRTYEVEDACGNTIQVEQIIIIDSYTPSFSVNGTDPTQCGVADGFITISGLDPNSDYTISFNGGTSSGFTSDLSGEYTITGLSAGTYSGFTIEDGDCPACSTTDPVTITLTDPNPPSIDAGQNQEVCEGETVTLTATNPDGATISWDNGITDGSAFTPPSGTTTYTVTATDASGCQNTDQVDVIVNAGPTVEAGLDTTVCEGETVTLTGSGTAVSYTWDNGATDGVPFTPSQGTTTYTVTGVDANGCSSTDQVDVTATPGPVAAFTATPSSGQPPLVVNFSNQSGNGTSYNWDFGNGTTANNTSDQDESSTYNDTGTYIVVLTVSNGNCSNQASATIVVEDSPLNYVIPNGFTPNDDGVNDIFHMSISNAESVEIEIFNRWGNMVGKITSLDPSNGWDGNDFSGNPVTDGVYFYTYKIIDLQGEEHTGHQYLHLEKNK